jgi:hypothetical protein
MPLTTDDVVRKTYRNEDEKRWEREQRAKRRKTLKLKQKRKQKSIESSRERVELSPEGYDLARKMIDEPQPPNHRLREAAKRHWK